MKTGETFSSLPECDAEGEERRRRIPKEVSHDLTPRPARIDTFHEILRDEKHTHFSSRT